MKIKLLFFFFLALTNTGFSQITPAFHADRDETTTFRLKKKIKREVRKIKHGTRYDNGPESGMQTTHVPTIDSLIKALKKEKYVLDAAWDKCQVKISIYPGWLVIGVKYRTEMGIREICFHFQEGSLGTIRLFGWKPRIFKTKNKLIYKKMYACDGFVEEQQKICLE